MPQYKIGYLLYNLKMSSEAPCLKMIPLYLHRFAFKCLKFQCEHLIHLFYYIKLQKGLKL